MRGVPMRVFESAPPTMRFVWELAAGYGDRDYLVFEDERLHLRRADAIIRSLAHHLRDVHGVGTGDRVGDRHAQLSRVGVQLLGDRVARCCLRRA